MMDQAIITKVEEKEGKKQHIGVIFFEVREQVEIKLNKGEMRE